MSPPGRVESSTPSGPIRAAASCTGCASASGPVGIRRLRRARRTGRTSTPPATDRDSQCRDRQRTRGGRRRRHRRRGDRRRSGTVWARALGAVFLATIKRALPILGIPGLWQQAVVGCSSSSPSCWTRSRLDRAPGRRESSLKRGRVMSARLPAHYAGRSGSGLLIPGSVGRDRPTRAGRGLSTPGTPCPTSTAAHDLTSCWSTSLRSCSSPCR